MINLALLAQQFRPSQEEATGGLPVVPVIEKVPWDIFNPALLPKLQSLTGEEFISKFVSALIALLLIVGVIIAFFLLLIGGIQWMTSGGDKAATEAARGRITAALIGLLLLFSAWAVIKLIETFLGITILGGPIILPKIQ